MGDQKQEHHDHDRSVRHVVSDRTSDQERESSDSDDSSGGGNEKDQKPAMGTCYYRRDRVPSNSSMKTQYEVIKKTTFRIRPVEAGNIFGDSDEDTDPIKTITQKQLYDDDTDDGMSTGDDEMALLGKSDRTIRFSNTLESSRKPVVDEGKQEKKSCAQPRSTTQMPASSEGQAFPVGQDAKNGLAHVETQLSPHFKPSPSKQHKKYSQNKFLAPHSPRRISSNFKQCLQNGNSIPDFPKLDRADSNESDFDEFSVQLSVSTKVSDITMNDFNADQTQQKGRARMSEKRNYQGEDKIKNGASCDENDLFDTDYIPATTPKKLYEDSESEHDNDAWDDDKEYNGNGNNPCEVEDTLSFQDGTISSRTEDDSREITITGCISGTIPNLLRVVEEGEDEEEQDQDDNDDDEEDNERDSDSDGDNCEEEHEQKMTRGRQLIWFGTRRTMSDLGPRLSRGCNSKCLSRQMSFSSVCSEANSTSILSNATNESDTMSILEEKRKLRAERLAMAKERIRKQEKDKIRQEQRKKHSMETEEDDELGRLQRTYQWYNRCGCPSKAKFQSCIKTMHRKHGFCDISLADIDLLPWTDGGTRVKRISAHTVFQKKCF